MSKMLQPRLSLILESDSKVKRMRKKRVKLFADAKLVHFLSYHIFVRYFGMISQYLVDEK